MITYGDGANRRFLYEYNLKDHLGNNRVTFMGTSLGGAIDVAQTTNYYPFGLVMNQGGNTKPTNQKNKYLYNGKELQDDKMTAEALNLYDYGARFYDPQIARWTTIDPLAEKGRRWSPYVYAFDDPIRYTDPDGRWPWEDPNVKWARSYARKTGGEFQKWKGADGKKWASVTTKSTTKGEDGEVILSTQVFKPSREDQSSGIGNLFASLDGMNSRSKGDDSKGRGLDGHSDPANNAERGKQAPLLVKAVANMIPIVAGANLVQTYSTGNDVYNEKATILGTAASAFNVTATVTTITLGFLGKACEAAEKAEAASVIIDVTATIIDESTRGEIEQEEKNVCPASSTYIAH